MNFEYRWIGDNYSYIPIMPSIYAIWSVGLYKIFIHNNASASIDYQSWRFVNRTALNGSVYYYHYSNYSYDYYKYFLARENNMSFWLTNIVYVYLNDNFFHRSCPSWWNISFILKFYIINF